jgi:large subunit ribosomal protein L7/L12
MVVSINLLVKTLNTLPKAARSTNLNLNFCKKISTSNKTQLTQAAATNAQAPIPPPHFEGQSKEYAPKIKQLVDEIAKLNLIEVSDLNELLRKKLNIKDVAMSFAPQGGVAASATPAAPKEEEEAEAPKAVKSSFRLKLLKYDEAKKVALIKEVKALGENMNLVQAKKFIESVPQVFRDNISKDEAEKLKTQLEKAGGTLVIE